MEKRILIAEDDENTVALIIMLLESQDYRILVAADGEECLKKVDGFKPDLILLDVLMPKIDGMMALRTIRKNSDSQAIPVIMITVLSDAEEEAFELGISDFIAKPFNPGDFKQQVNNALAA